MKALILIFLMLSFKLFGQDVVLPKNATEEVIQEGNTLPNSNTVPPTTSIEAEVKPVQPIQPEATPVPVTRDVTDKPKDKVLDFSAGVIEGDVNRPSMLMELGSNYKEFNDLILLRDDFNAFHEIDSMKRFRYFDEGL